jgi:hypothetical protein
MMWLHSILQALSVEQIVNVLSAALCFALAAGMNDRLGALIAGFLALVLVVI